jgi:hypothetical protein
MTEATHPIEEMLLTAPGSLKKEPAEDAINAISGPLLELEAFNYQLMELHRQHVLGKRRRGRI